jgi:hypothetical protein
MSEKTSMKLQVATSQCYGTTPEDCCKHDDKDDFSLQRQGKESKASSAAATSTNKSFSLVVGGDE